MTTRAPWFVFVGALVVVVTVMGLVTSKLVALDRDRTEADRRGAHEEQVRLALWRLDSDTTPLLMQEIAAMTLLGDPVTEQALPPAGAHLHARFVLEHDGRLRTVGDERDGDDSNGTPAVDDSLAARVDLETLRPLLPEPADGEIVARLENPVLRASATRAGTPVATKGSYSSAEQRMFNDNELARRVQALNGNLEGYSGSIANTVGRWGDEIELDQPPPPAGAVRPIWIDDELFLLRRVRTAGGEAIHGAWLNWPALRDRLLAEIQTPLPHASLIPVPDDALDANAENLLATLPIRLVPGAPNVIVERTASLLPSLALGWAGVLAAIVAVFAVLRWSLALSERRAVFVSTVTHELRTPLTTFRMYTEMLQEGMVDETRRSRYVATLRREADRLGALVENVLAYARIESDKTPLAPETLTVEALVQRVFDRLADRASEAGLELALDVGPLADAPIVVDPAAAEQILFNLVDNAAKYGSSQDAPRIELSAREAGNRIALCVRDHGPGIPHAERKTVFAPFAKAEADSSGTKPGVGLGLALCRRLARQLSGELTVEPAEPGARFVLTLPRGR